MDDKNSCLFYVSRSSIHGRGLFAATRIGAGQVIGRVRGVPTRRNGPHVLWLSEKRALRVTCDLRFINHSESPNAKYYDDGQVVAIKAIRPHEEITHDYDGL